MAPLVDKIEDRTDTAAIATNRKTADEFGLSRSRISGRL